MVSQKPDLDYIAFKWNKMTASEFEEHWKVKKMTKKADFIHMIQVGVSFLSTVSIFYISKFCSFGRAINQQ